MTNGNGLRALGVDVSHHQHQAGMPPQLDWLAMGQAGVAFAFVKATEGTSLVDSRLEVNWTGPKAAGLLRAPYHFFLPRLDPALQARHFVRTMQGDPGEMPPVLDVEAIQGVDNATLIRGVEVWLNEAEALLGRVPIIYTRAGIWNDHLRLPSGQFPPWTRNYPLWAAHYPFARDGADPEKGPLPPLPALETISRFNGQLLPKAWDQWTFWQYTQRGLIAGAPRHVDLDLFNGTVDELRAWARQALEGAATPSSRRRSDRPVIVTRVDPARPVVVTPVGPGAPLTNQRVINVFFKAAATLGVDAPDLMARAGLDLIAMVTPESNRQLPYAGPPLEALPGLTPGERVVLLAVLNNQLAPATPIVSPPPAAFASWGHPALPGLHGPADPGGGWVPDAFEVVQQSRVQAVKVLVPDVQLDEVARLRAINPDMFIMARLFSGQLHEPRPQGGDGTPEAAGRWFANEVADPGDANSPMQRAINAGIRFFEVHNEPNLTLEGLGANWRDGAEFARFFRTVVETLRPRFPNAQFGFPGLSPGPVAGPRLIDVPAFLQQARAAVELADFVCCHVYWGQAGVDLPAALRELQAFCSQFAGKRIICSEFSNNSPALSRELKAQQYAEFYRACRALPPNLGAMFAFTLSWRNDLNSEGFLQMDPDGTFRMTPMAQVLGSLEF